MLLLFFAMVGIEKETFRRDYVSKFVEIFCSKYDQAIVALFAALQKQNSTALVDFYSKF